MSRAIVLGERNLVLGFKGAGFEIIAVEDAVGFHREAAKLSREPGIELVLVTESMAAESPQVVSDFRKHSGAILVVVPTHEGSKRIGFHEMKKAMERSIGIDILGKE